MELEPEVLLQEARENVEAAQSYRRELGQRLQGLREARRQVGGPLPEGRCGPRGGHGVPSGWTRASSTPSGESIQNSEGRRQESLKVQGDLAGSGNRGGGYWRLS